MTGGAVEVAAVMAAETSGLPGFRSDEQFLFILSG
jgi:hypothetical protein